MNHIGQLDVKGYHRLPLSLRDQLDAWVRDEGFELGEIFHMELLEDNKSVNVYVWLRDAEGKRYMDWDIGAPAQAVLCHQFKTQPPKGVFT